MDQLVDVNEVTEALSSGQAWVFEHVLVWSTLIQLLLVIGAYLAARLLAPMFTRWFNHLAQRPRLEGVVQKASGVIATLTLPLIWLVVQWVSIMIALQAGWPHHLIQIVVSLLTAWVVIRVASQLVRDPSWAKFIAVSAWIFAALNIIGLLDDAVALLDAYSITLGELRISILTVTKGLVSMAILVWLATFLARLLERRINEMPNLTPSVQVLFNKVLKLTLVVIAVFAALRSIGIDITAFAVFTGALGVGVGFGLQKGVSNLISGIMLLLDKSIKPGDVIAVGETFGWVSSLGGRYVSVVTRDGIEHLIPNEEFITRGVENWSYSSKSVRLKIPLGVSYNADLREAIRLCKEAAGAAERVLDDPAPNCLIKGFGDSSVDLELRIWIDDPDKGVSNIKSEVMLNVWDRFHEHAIEIPFPQRDLHIRSAVPIAALPQSAA